MTPNINANRSRPVLCLPDIPETGGRQKSEGEYLLADTLLRRGFPVCLEDRGLALCSGAMPEDVAFLTRLLRQPRSGHVRSPSPLPVWHEEQKLLEVDIRDDGRLAAFRSRVLGGRTVTPSGMTGPPCRITDRMNSFEGFQDCRFGARFPLKFIEEGVALLVKVLPWVGVLTSMSCEGHLDQDRTSSAERAMPNIWFYSHYHAEWCRLIFERLCGDVEIAHDWRFEKSGDGWLDNVWHASSQPPDSPLDQSRIFDRTQLMARRFFDPELCRRIRGAKQAAQNADDLAGSLDRALREFEQHGGSVAVAESGP
jgi:hypothetical protein